MAIGTGGRSRLTAALRQRGAEMSACHPVCRTLRPGLSHPSSRPALQAKGGSRGPVLALDQVIEVRALEGQSAVAERVEAPSSGDSRSEALTISRLLTYLRVVGSYLRL